MALLFSGTAIANVALTDTFNTWRQRFNQVVDATEANFTGTVTAPRFVANTASIKSLQADVIDFDGDMTVDTVTANNLAGTITTASQGNITTVGALNGGSITSGFGNIDVGSSNIDGGTITADTSLVGTLGTAAQPNITSVGALNGGSITSGFGSIDVGSSNIDGGTITADTSLVGTLGTAAQPNITSVGTLSSLTVTGDINGSGHLDLGDGDIIKLGASDDLQIQHNGTHSYISDSGTGNLYIQTSAGLIIQNAGGTETMGTFTENGAVALYYDNATKLATKSDGVDITGELQSDSLDVDGAADISGALTVGAAIAANASSAATHTALDVDGAVAHPVIALGSGYIDCSTGNYFTRTAGGATTWSFNSVPASRAYGFMLRLTNGGNYTMTWPASVDWPGGSAPSLTSSGVDMLVFVTDNGGTTWYGNLAMAGLA